MNNMENPFDYDAYLQLMTQDKRKAIRFIALFLKIKGLRYDSKDEMSVVIKRHLRASNDAVKFSSEKINKALDACEKMNRENGVSWTIETVVKMMTK